MPARTAHGVSRLAQKGLAGPSPASPPWHFNRCNFHFQCSTARKLQWTVGWNSLSATAPPKLYRTAANPTSGLRGSPVKLQRYPGPSRDQRSLIYFPRFWPQECHVNNHGIKEQSQRLCWRCPVATCSLPCLPRTARSSDWSCRDLDAHD